ncbi:MAG: ABC transporter permease subunit [Chloroflexota bacterium]
MTTTAGPVPAPAPVPLPVLPFRQRIIGFASVYAKTMRDARLAFLIVAGMTAGLMFAVSAAIPGIFPTQAARDEMARLATDMGAVAQGLAGKPVNVGTLGGYVQWKYGAFFVWIVALWSILALSGTLAGEARKGSLELIASLPLGRRRIAWEKVAAHLTLLAAVLVLTALAAFVAGAAFGTLPGDAIPLGNAIGYAAWLGVMALAFGSLAFALSQVLGRGAGAAISGLLLFAGWILTGYQASVPPFRPLAALSPWSWTQDHLPLAGQTDWLSLLPVAIIPIVLLPLGVVLFDRRDLGATRGLRLPRLLSLPALVGGVARRAFSERLPVALAWGLGIGLFGMVVASMSATFADELKKLPDIQRFFASTFPGIDTGSAGGFLQFVFVDMGIVIVGFAAATLVSGWASDETSGRVELLLTAPVSRRAWAARSAAGAMGAVAVVTLLLALGIGIGAVASGSEALTPMLGTIPIGLWMAALVGIGVAAGGLGRPWLAAELVALVVIVTFLIDLLGPVLQLPDAVLQLALTSHLGRPMIGEWDWPGLAVCLALAVGGVLVGAWGFGRRDLGR